MDGRGGGSSIFLCVDDLIRNKDGKMRWIIFLGGGATSRFCVSFNLLRDREIFETEGLFS